jgi:hypothetical protein
MRILMTAQIPTAPGNKAIVEKKMGETMGRVLERLKPEVTYFTLSEGMRTAYIVFDLADPSDMPTAAEELFIDLDALIDMKPAMTPDDLQAGLARL